jgi:hypothetical protein
MCRRVQDSTGVQRVTSLGSAAYPQDPCLRQHLRGSTRRSQSREGASGVCFRLYLGYAGNLFGHDKLTRVVAGAQ